MSEFINVVRSAAEGGLDGVSDAVILAMGVVCGLLIIVSIFALGVSIFLAISYVRYNKKQNSCGKTGQQIARTILDRNGLGKIKVSNRFHSLRKQLQSLFQKGAAQTPYMEKAECDISCHGGAEIRACRS